MFDWLSELFDWIVQVVPRLVIVRSTHRGVKFVRGKHLKLVEPGLCWYWPLVTEIVVLAVSRQTMNLPTQRLVTNDGKRIITSAVVVYVISDAIQAVGKSWDYDETVRDVSMASIASIVTSRKYPDLVEGLADVVRKDLTIACRQGLMKYGIRVQRCLLTDFCPANVIALSNSDQVVLGE